MPTKLATTLAVMFAGAALTANALAHCEVPCGIYDDMARFAMIEEHATTVEKAMKQIDELSAAEKPNNNQIARWVANKESHATEIQTIVSQYFLTQRIKAGSARYETKLTLLHQLLVAAMKAKQTTDVAHVAKIRELNKNFKEAYFGAEGMLQIEHMKKTGAGRRITP